MLDGDLPESWESFIFVQVLGKPTFKASSNWFPTPLCNNKFCVVFLSLFFVVVWGFFKK